MASIIVEFFFEIEVEFIVVYDICIVGLVVFMNIIIVIIEIINYNWNFGDGGGLFNFDLIYWY